MNMNVAGKGAVLFFIFLSSYIWSQQTRADSILYDFTHKPEKVLVAAHRAAHEYHPENSLAAIQEAIRLGADIVELDIRATSDGVLVMMHDKSLDRTTTGSGLVAEHSWAQLQQLRLTHKGRPTQEKIPTFAQALNAARDSILIDVDFKLEGMPAILEAAKEIVGLEMESQVLFFLYERKEALALHQMYPAIKIMPRVYTRRQARRLMRTFPQTILHIDKKVYSEPFAQKMRARGIRLWLNSLGDIDRAEKADPGQGFSQLERYPRANVIQTDLPKALLAYLEMKAKR
ncbi:glycerophosphodiester phosphodiesterase family protein [Sediminicola luteus]|uniref:GP-PDE domain-containing protein n=1 Tax=Sediminicola luteus TaxID=319238 RepID=A0A2A4G613_9FLAO|nr:glycerophosphodiester phosphodiesterase family protein [Sediminicola luteus]PCE64409.1 hypothetical protein B7P33_08955 [Sediminicola luteus]